MSVGNRVYSNIEAAKMYLEGEIEIKLDEIEADNVKTIISLDMKISAITWNIPSSSYELPSASLTKW